MSPEVVCTAALVARVRSLVAPTAVSRMWPEPFAETPRLFASPSLTVIEPARAVRTIEPLLPAVVRSDCEASVWLEVVPSAATRFTVTATALTATSVSSRRLIEPDAA